MSFQISGKDNHSLAFSIVAGFLSRPARHQSRVQLKCLVIWSAVPTSAGGDAMMSNRKLRGNSSSYTDPSASIDVYQVNLYLQTYPPSFGLKPAYVLATRHDLSHDTPFRTTAFLRLGSNSIVTRSIDSLPSRKHKALHFLFSVTL